jgi:hypothetical protein
LTGLFAAVPWLGLILYINFRSTISIYSIEWDCQKSWYLLQNWPRTYGLFLHPTGLGILRIYLSRGDPTWDNCSLQQSYVIWSENLTILKEFLKTFRGSTCYCCLGNHKIMSKPHLHVKHVNIDHLEFFLKFLF